MHERYRRILSDGTLTLASERDIDAKLKAKLKKKFTSMMSALFKEQGASLRIDILKDPEIISFIDTHAEILDSAFSQTKMSDTMRSRLQESDWMFSGMKTFHELNEAFPSLLDENGNRKPFERFLNDVQKIDQTYNQHYLRAEYNFADASARMAGRWEGFVEDGDDYYLQYRTAGDDAVRPEHAALAGVTLPVDDSFWDTYYPPNGWNCRCTVVQVRKDKYPATSHDEAMERGKEALAKDKKGMFNFNPGKQQRTFPAYNPYTISKCATCPRVHNKLASVPDNQECASCDVNHDTYEKRRRDANYAEYERLKADKGYKDVAFNNESGGVKATSVSHKKDSDKERPVYNELTGKQLEKHCQENIFRIGGVCILEPENIRVNGQWASSLDATIGEERMDIASITKNTGNIFYNTITRKEGQVLKYNAIFESNAHCLALYFEEPSMFNEQIIREALTGYHTDKIHIGIIDTLYCVLNGADKIIIIK